jgi:hypothetical protein
MTKYGHPTPTTPPDGWHFVTAGKIKRGDKAWNYIDGKWNAPSREELTSILGPNAEDGWFAIIREDVQQKDPQT